MPREVAELFESFKADRMLTTFIADSDDPIYVSKNLLRRNSVMFNEVLQKADGFGQCNGDGVLRYPDDNLDAWKWLLYWMTLKRVPDCYEIMNEEDCDPAHLIRCCCLGDKYNIYLFQDAVMEQLLYRLQKISSFPLDAVAVSFAYVSASGLMNQLMTESLVLALNSGDIGYDDLSTFDGVPGLMASLAAGLVYDMVPDYDDYQRYMICDDGWWSQELPEDQYSTTNEVMVEETADWGPYKQIE